MSATTIRPLTTDETALLVDVRRLLHLGGVEALESVLRDALAILPADVVREAVGDAADHLGDFPVLGRG